VIADDQHLQFYAYGEMGGCIGNTEALARADFDCIWRSPLELKIRMNKSTLLEVMKKNRDEHKEIYKEALDAYCKKASKRCEEILAELERGEAAYVGIKFNAPEDHTSDYELAISMVENATETTIELNATDYAMLVRDEWGWQRRWLQASSSLIGGVNNSASKKCLAMYNER